MGFYTAPRWGFRDPAQRVAAELVNSLGGAKVRKMAGVYYQCHNRHPLGFAWPVVDRRVGELQGENVPEHALEFRAGGLNAFEPYFPIDVDRLRRPIEPAPKVDFVFFAHRRIDPEVEVYGDPLNAVETVGWMPAGVIAIESAETSFNVARSFSYEQQDRYALANGEERPESEKQIGITGERDVIRAVTGWRWKVHELNPPVIPLENPPGMVNCKCGEMFLSRDKVVEDIGKYRGRPIILW